MARKQNKTEETIEPGMEVEATRGDLGEEDVSKPKVTEVVTDQQGKVDKLIVQKGVIFKKTLEIPADRITSINQENSMDEGTQGKVIVDIGKKEAEALTSTGVEALDAEQQHGLLDSVEQEVPTAQGLRELEANNNNTQTKQTSVQPVDNDSTIPQEEKPQHDDTEDEESHTVPDKKTISSCGCSVQDS